MIPDSKNHQNSLLRTMLLILFLLTTAASPVIADSTCVLQMGWEPWKPYQYIDTKNQLTGLDIELIGDIVKNMRCELQLKKRPWKRLLMETQKGNMDLVAGASISEERKKWAYFTEAYRQQTMVMYVLAGTTGQFPFTSFKDLIGNNFRLAVNRGAYYGEEFDELMKSSKFKKSVHIVGTEEQKYKLLFLGRVKGFLGDPVSMTYLMRKEGVLDRVEIHPMKIYSSNQYVMFSKKSTTPELVEKFNKSLAILKKNGIHTKILKKYLE